MDRHRGKYKYNSVMCTFYLKELSLVLYIAVTYACTNITAALFQNDMHGR